MPAPRELSSQAERTSRMESPARKQSSRGPADSSLRLTLPVAALFRLASRCTFLSLLLAAPFQSLQFWPRPCSSSSSLWRPSLLLLLGADGDGPNRTRSDAPPALYCSASNGAARPPARPPALPCPRAVLALLPRSPPSRLRSPSRRVPLVPPPLSALESRPRACPIDSPQMVARARASSNGRRPSVPFLTVLGLRRSDRTVRSPVVAALEHLSCHCFGRGFVRLLRSTWIRLDGAHLATSARLPRHHNFYVAEVVGWQRAWPWPWAGSLDQYDRFFPVFRRRRRDAESSHAAAVRRNLSANGPITSLSGHDGQTSRNPRTTPACPARALGRLLLPFGRGEESRSPLHAPPNDPSLDRSASWTDPLDIPAVLEPPSCASFCSSRIDRPLRDPLCY
ncbi:hypothetical protein Mp_8g11820 [Marchantia polymorpha subsp. ruderalis]|uniref:Uncharacterized protein n=1 Tax=Marchantia polymorpha TaxID=3197 RepID=A0A2R6XM96_MARPO|nr:hypothetical protein MARPO_0008s0034 [Marchantia polymorpha]BBN19577.1 hypothetical protein Mp_8g11820 [Marchantia polymorpha subsp. ruderalis]|eukprot:PTQ47247.1 hypothetical protein MARPO_0008s0034 [Marchantia polymorpha]